MAALAVQGALPADADAPRGMQILHRILDENPHRVRSVPSRIRWQRRLWLLTATVTALSCAALVLGLLEETDPEATRDAEYASAELEIDLGEPLSEPELPVDPEAQLAAETTSATERATPGLAVRSAIFETSDTPPPRGARLRGTILTDDESDDESTALSVP